MKRTSQLSRKPFWAKGSMPLIWMFILGAMLGVFFSSRQRNQVTFYCDYNSNKNGCVRYLPSEIPEDVMIKQLQANRQSKDSSRATFSTTVN